MAATTPARETQEAPGKDEDTGRRGQPGAWGPQEHPHCGILGQAGCGASGVPSCYGVWHRLLHRVEAPLLECLGQHCQPSPTRLPPNRLTSYVFRVYALAYPTMTISVLSLDSVCNIANWIITHRQRTRGNFVEESPVVMWSMQVPTIPLAEPFK